MNKLFTHRLFILLTGAALFIFNGSAAQNKIAQPYRFEEEQKSSDLNYTIVPLQQEGLALVRDNEKYENGKKIWELILLDSALQKTTSTTLLLNNRNRFIGYEYLPGHLYLLFRNGEVNSNDLHLLDYSLRTKESSLHEIKHNFDLRITHFSIAGSNAVFGGYLSKEPAVLLYSLEEKQVKVVPGFFMHDTELLDLRVNHNQTFNVLMIERGSRDIKRLVVRTFDQVGTQLLEDIIPIQNDITLLTGMTSTLVRDELLIVGTYSTGANRLATGFYSVPVNPFAEQVVHFTDFSQLNHFLDYLGESKSSKVKENAQRQRQKGKDPSFRSSIALIRLQETTKGFLLLAENYTAASTSVSPYPSYYANPYGYYNNAFSPYAFNNRSYSQPYSYNNVSQNSDVKMQESVLVLFEDSGKPVWDESLELNLKITALEQSSDFVETSHGITLAFKNKSDIFSKYLPGQNPATLDTTRLRLQNEFDKVKNDHEQDGGIRYWYKNYFYVWGYQSLKSHGPDDPSSRNVFFINKMGVE